MSDAPLDGRLGPSELRILEAITARLIPGNETGPGAREARVSRYIDGALQAEYATHLAEYRRGLAATESYSQSRFAHGFADLAEDEQDAVLTAIERDDATGFDTLSSVFFARVRQHTIEGMFGDPSWGGNAGRVGWALLGYPGPHEKWTEADQALEEIPVAGAAGERHERVADDS